MKKLVPLILKEAFIWTTLYMPIYSSRFSYVIILATKLILLLMLMMTLMSVNKAPTTNKAHIQQIKQYYLNIYETLRLVRDLCVWKIAAGPYCYPAAVHKCFISFKCRKGKKRKASSKQLRCCCTSKYSKMFFFVIVFLRWHVADVFCIYCYYPTLLLCIIVCCCVLKYYTAACSIRSGYKQFHTALESISEIKLRPTRLISVFNCISANNNTANKQTTRMHKYIHTHIYHIPYLWPAPAALLLAILSLQKNCQNSLFDFMATS